MPPVKRRAKGTKAPPNRWTRGEIDVLLKCLGSEEFLSKHAKTLQKRQFPTFSLRDACVKENEYHGVCVALSEEILNQAGEHNNLNLRPFASIASKILDMTAKIGMEGLIVAHAVAYHSDSSTSYGSSSYSSYSAYSS